jgi:predicted GNAT family N-acyltransferase
MSHPDHTVHIETVAWEQQRETLRNLRGTVFIQEQQVPQDVEWDDQDADATHFLISSDNTPIGCGRLLADGKVGRMAILPEQRRRGIGAQLLAHILEAGKARGLRRLYLHAQTHALPFYEACGFIAQGDIFSEAGIEHQAMEVELNYSGFNQFISGVTYPQPFARLAIELAITADRELRIFSPSLDHDIFDNPDMADALSQLARRSRLSRVRILVTDWRPLVARGHRLVTVAQRLSSIVQIQEISNHPEAPADTFLVRDLNGTLYNPGEADRNGFFEPDSRASARRFIDRFDLLWHKSQPHPELRILGI